MLIICCVTVVYFLWNRYEPRIYKSHYTVVLMLDTQYTVIMSPDNLVGIMIGLRAGPNHVGGQKCFFSPKCGLQTACGNQPASYSNRNCTLLPRGQSGRNMNQTIHLPLIPRLTLRLLMSYIYIYIYIYIWSAYS